MSASSSSSGGRRVFGSYEDALVLSAFAKKIAVRRKFSAGPVQPVWAGKAGFGVLHSIEEFMSDTT